jgi:hypothetical protein
MGRKHVSLNQKEKKKARAQEFFKRYHAKRKASHASAAATNADVGMQGTSHVVLETNYWT